MAERVPVEYYVSNAARRSGYDPVEVATLVVEPRAAFDRYELDSALLSTFQTAKIFTELIKGKEIDYRVLVRFANQLHHVRQTPSCINDTTDASRRLRFTSHEERRLLFVKNLLEEAFFDGALVDLKGEIAGAVAFFANRLAKVVHDVELNRRVRFSFDQRKFNKILQDTDAFCLKHFNVDAELRELETGLINIYNRIFTEDDPYAVRYRTLKKELSGLVAPDVETPFREYFHEFQSMQVSSLLFAFDTLVPFEIPDRDKVKACIVQAFDNFSRPDCIRKAFFLIAQSNMCPVVAIANSFNENRHGSPSEKENKQIKRMFENFLTALALKGASIKNRASLNSLIALVEKLVRSPDRRLGDLVAVERDRIAKQREMKELYKQIVRSPKNAKLLSQKEALERSLIALKDGYRIKKYNAYLDSRSTFLSAKENEDAQVFFLHFIKDYMVAVGKLSHPDSSLEDSFDDVGGKVIHTYSFSGNQSPRGAFSDVHYRPDFLPLAQAVVMMQRAKRKENIRQP